MAAGVSTLVKVGLVVAAVFALALGCTQLTAAVQAPSLGPAVVVSSSEVPLQSPRSGTGPRGTPSTASPGRHGAVPSQSPRSGTGPSRAPLPAPPGRHGTPGGDATPLPLPLAGEDVDADDQNETLDDEDSEQDTDGEADEED